MNLLWQIFGPPLIADFFSELGRTQNFCFQHVSCTRSESKKKMHENWLKGENKQGNKNPCARKNRNKKSKVLREDSNGKFMLKWTQKFDNFAS